MNDRCQCAIFHPAAASVLKPHSFCQHPQEQKYMSKRGAASASSESDGLTDSQRGKVATARRYCSEWGFVTTASLRW